MQENNLSRTIDVINHGTGVVNKICLVFPRIFWPLDIKRFGLLSPINHNTSPINCLGNHVLVINMYSETNLPCLLIYTCGFAALDMEAKKDCFIIEEILDRLSLCFPAEQPLPYPIETVLTRWSQDTFSRKFDESFLNLNSDSLIFASKISSGEKDISKGIFFNKIQKQRAERTLLL
jgi:hypothetical protein